MALAPEALCAVTGIFPDKPINKGDGRAAAALPSEWRREIAEFFDADKPIRFTLYPRPDHMKVLDTLTAGMTIDETAKITGKLDDTDVGQAYLTQLSNAREYVRQRWPALSLDTPTGPQILEPGWTVMSEAYEVLAVVDDPSRILKEMRMHTLTGAQVDALKAVYPDLADMLTKLVSERLVQLAARKKSYSVGWRKERVLRVLWGMPGDASLSEVTQPPAKAVTVPKISIDFKDQATKAQTLEAK